MRLDSARALKSDLLEELTRAAGGCMRDEYPPELPTY
jgi:hypothetical protein